MTFLVHLFDKIYVTRHFAITFKKCFDLNHNIQHNYVRQRLTTFNIVPQAPLVANERNLRTDGKHYYFAIIRNIEYTFFSDIFIF